MLIAEALQMLSLGFSVIPLRERSKEPLINWKEYQSRRASESEVREWLKKWPDINVGVVTGAISNVTVLDLDGIQGLMWLAKNPHVSSSTITLSGSGGKHLWFLNDPTIRNSASKIAPGVDIRGEGGYVVVPPSIHPSGRRYRWVSTPKFTALSAFPTDIITNISPSQTIVGSQNTAAGSNTAFTPKPEGWVSEALEEMKNGHIHNTLISILGKFRAHNFSIADTYKLLQPYAMEDGKPYGGLQAKIEEIWNRYEHKPSSERVGTAIQSGLVLHTPSNPDSQQQFRELQMGTKRASEFATGYTAFDSLTGGIRRGEVLTVAARTGVGKTNWLIGPIRNLCRNGRKVLLFSTEMSFDQIWSRYKATLSTLDAFEDHKFFICDDFAPNIERIEEALKLAMPDIFLFDHINNVGEEHHQLSEFMKGLKFLARKFNIPCIMTAQLNRGADWVENGEKVKPRLSMIKGSGAIEEVSAQVLLLDEKRVTLEGTEIAGYVDKNRHGDKGLVQFILKKEPYRIVEADK